MKTVSFENIETLSVDYEVDMSDDDFDNFLTLSFEGQQLWLAEKKFEWVQIDNRTHGKEVAIQEIKMVEKGKKTDLPDPDESPYEPDPWRDRSVYYS